MPSAFWTSELHHKTDLFLLFYGRALWEVHFLLVRHENPRCSTEWLCVLVFLCNSVYDYIVTSTKAAMFSAYLFVCQQDYSKSPWRISMIFRGGAGHVCWCECTALWLVHLHPVWCVAFLHYAVVTLLIQHVLVAEAQAATTCSHLHFICFAVIRYSINIIFIIYTSSGGMFNIFMIPSFTASKSKK